MDGMLKKQFVLHRIFFAVRAEIHLAVARSSPWPLIFITVYCMDRVGLETLKLRVARVALDLQKNVSRQL